MIVDTLLWGFIASLALTLIIFAGEGLGVSRISLTYMLGTAFTGDRDRANVIGFTLHFAFGVVLALLYRFLLAGLGGPTLWTGAAVGLGHGLVVLVVLLPMLPYVHPRMATPHHGPESIRGLEPPGFLALHYGRATPAVTILAHLAYGVVLGLFL